MTRYRSALFLIVAVGVLKASIVLPQSKKAEARLAFDVASIKFFDLEKMRSVCGNCDHYGYQLDAERLLDRTSLLTYIVKAYGYQHLCMLKVGVGETCPMISGNIPAWVNDDRWEIQAKLPPNTPLGSAREGLSPELRLMLRTLLEDRFHLKAHLETRQLPVFVLTRGGNALKLKPTPPKGEFIKLPDGGLREVHGMGRTERVSTPDGVLRLRYSYQAISMQEAVDQFSSSFDRPVLDQTGLKGDYDFVMEVEWPSDAGRGLPGRFPSAAALSGALQEVGLRLESTKAPVEVLVIDHVEKPSEN